MGFEGAGSSNDKSLTSRGHGENLKIAVRMMSRGIFNLENLITHKWILNDVQKAFEYAANKPGDYIKGIIVP